MAEAAAPGDWYEAACRRARAGQRRRVASTDWPEFAPPVALSTGPLGEIQAADREIARQTARRARAVAEFAASRPASADRAQGEPGAMSPERWAARPDVLRGVSEWAAQELVVALSISPQAAETLLARSLTLVHRLPGTLAALEAGALHPGHLFPMLEKVAPIADDIVRAEVEAGLLRWAAGRVTTPTQLGAKARREVLLRDARAAARRLATAIAERGVHLQEEPVDGMGAVTAVLTVPEQLAMYRALGAYVDALPNDPDDLRTRGNKMADCLLDRVLRPGESDVPPVQVLLTVVAPVGTLAGGDEPGEVDGQVVPAAMIRELVRTLGPATSAESADLHTTGGTGTEQFEGAEQLEGAEQFEQADLERWWAELERRVLADELGPGPDPYPPDELLRAAADAGPPECHLDPVHSDDLTDNGHPCDPPPNSRCCDPPPDGRSCDPSARGLSGRDFPSEDSTSDVPPRNDTTDDGWWATADRAVDEASAAARSAGEALSRAQRLVRTASAADAADEAAWQTGPAGRVTEAEDALAVLRAAGQEHCERLADLLDATAGGGLAERPRIALTHALTGALLALTDLPEMRRIGTCERTDCRRHPERCEHDLSGGLGLGPPGPTDGYRPSAVLDRWVRTRDRRCRFPGCRRRVPRGGELDHDRPYPLGPTSAANLTGYCTGHHRGKHQAPGWRYDLAPDGALAVTSPTGLMAVTTPPPF